LVRSGSRRIARLPWLLGGWLAISCLSLRLRWFFHPAAAEQEQQAEEQQ
jgi:hypothetical protein